ncbi:unnamed protein product, partial [Hymenolepis diminuta]
SFDFRSIAEAQRTDSESHEFQNRPNFLQLKDLPLTTALGSITCDVSTSIPRPFAPKSFRPQVLNPSTIYHIPTNVQQ